MHTICTVLRTHSLHLIDTFWWKENSVKVENCTKSLTYTKKSMWIALARFSTGMCVVWALSLFRREVFHMTWISTENCFAHSTKSTHTFEHSVNIVWLVCTRTHTHICTWNFISLPLIQCAYLLPSDKCKVDWNKSAWGTNEFSVFGWYGYLG